MSRSDGSMSSSTERGKPLRKPSPPASWHSATNLERLSTATILDGGFPQTRRTFAFDSAKDKGMRLSSLVNFITSQVIEAALDGGNGVQLVLVGGVQIHWARGRQASPDTENEGLE